MSNLRQGRIVHVEMLDPQGRNPKVRPGVIVSETADIHPEGEILIVAITGETTASPPEVCVRLPWLGTGHPKTGLTKPSVAVINWQAFVPVSKILGAKGLVPAPQLYDILRLLAQHPNPRLAPPTHSNPPPVIPPPPAPL